MSYLRYLCLLTYIGVQHFCFVFLRLVNHMLPVSLECAFWIAHSVFSNIYLLYSDSFSNLFCFYLYVLLVYFFVISEMHCF
jgi:hypothetical protein